MEKRKGREKGEEEKTGKGNWKGKWEREIRGDWEDEVIKKVIKKGELTLKIRQTTNGINK